MDRKEAARRIRDHMIVHMLREERAIFITEALNEAIESLEAWDQVIEELENEIKMYKYESRADNIGNVKQIKEAKVSSYTHALEIIKRNLGELNGNKRSYRNIR